MLTCTRWFGGEGNLGLAQLSVTRAMEKGWLRAQEGVARLGRWGPVSHRGKGGGTRMESEVKCSAETDGREKLSRVMLPGEGKVTNLTAGTGPQGGALAQEPAANADLPSWS